MQGGEGHAPPRSRWQDRPHQKFVHLVFLSARPESFKGLTVSLSQTAFTFYSLLHFVSLNNVKAQFGRDMPDMALGSRKLCL